MLIKLNNYIETMDQDDIASHSKIVSHQLLTLIEQYMIPKTKMSEPEYHENNGKQLQTIAVNTWDKE